MYSKLRAQLSVVHFLFRVIFNYLNALLYPRIIISELIEILHYNSIILESYWARRALFSIFFKFVGVINLIAIPSICKHYSIYNNFKVFGMNQVFKTKRSKRRTLQCYIIVAAQHEPFCKHFIANLAGEPSAPINKK